LGDGDADPDLGLGYFDAQLLTLTTSKAEPGATAPINKRARLREATNPPSRAS
jgi:hypothetical protein